MTAQMKTNASAKKLSIHLAIFTIPLLSVPEFPVSPQRFVSTKLAIPTINLLKKQDVWVALGVKTPALLQIVGGDKLIIPFC